MVEITLEYLKKMRATYRNSELYGRELAAAAKTPAEVRRYEDEAQKALGMKEGVEGLIFDLTGEFPND